MQAKQMKMQQSQEQSRIEHEQNQDHIAALDFGLRKQDADLARRKSGIDVTLDPKQQLAINGAKNTAAEPGPPAMNAIARFVG